MKFEAMVIKHESSKRTEALYGLKMEGYSLGRRFLTRLECFGMRTVFLVVVVCCSLSPGHDVIDLVGNSTSSEPDEDGDHAVTLTAKGKGKAKANKQVSWTDSGPVTRRRRNASSGGHGIGSTQPPQLLKEASARPKPRPIYGKRDAAGGGATSGNNGQATEDGNEVAESSSATAPTSGRDERPLDNAAGPESSARVRQDRQPASTQPNINVPATFTHPSSLMNLVSAEMPPRPPSHPVQHDPALYGAIGQRPYSAGPQAVMMGFPAHGYYGGYPLQHAGFMPPPYGGNMYARSPYPEEVPGMMGAYPLMPHGHGQPVPKGRDYPHEQPPGNPYEPAEGA
ncbi:hypothetical protein NEOLEDRAFT_1184441 [Neolentinus lepideus HHB14362 ss-1]|uniref:Uncharacterized protein n=1 Tax=Neolentinus lepideus HHB14362 ss-1 TaxID=1314782 RepID=A0A165MEL8_9AGAM|nr:hypothetical protein NEOLEDRAFT_1184441 [Neolentinus lepideus HHB14362 ss-1]